MKQQTKDKILQTAIELFSTKGFNATSTIEIAQRAGVAEVTVFRHYKTKKDILMAVLGQFMDTFEQEFLLNPLNNILEKHSGEPSKEILKMIIKDRVALIEKNSDIIWIIITEMKYHTELKERIMGTFGASVLQIMNKALWKDSDSDVSKRPYTEAAIRAFMGTVISIVLHYKVLGDIIPLTRTMDEGIDEAVEILLHGISKS